MARLKKEYGSVMEYVQNQRLKWTDLNARGRAFEDPGMYMFLGFFYRWSSGGYLLT